MNNEKPKSSKNSFLKKSQKQIARIVVNRKNRKIIKKFSYIKEYDVLSFEAFRSAANQKIARNPKGTLIMGDINDLYQANKNRGKKQVNSMIKRMVNAIKYNVKDYSIDDYLLGKMGDELYLYVPDKKKSQCNELIEDLKKVSVHELSLSIGASDNLNEGIDAVLTQADQEMSQYKKNFKCEKVKRLYGKNLNNIIDCVVSTQLEKMRINLKKLNSSDLVRLRQTFDKAISELSVEKIIEDSLKEKQTIEEYGQQKGKGITQKQHERYRKEANILYGANASDTAIENYILSQTISRHRVNGAQNFTYFEGAGYKEVEKHIRKDKKSKAFNILIMNMSGLKRINDVYGHDAGDLAINDSIKYMQQAIKKQNITTYSDIVVRGGDMAIAFIPDIPFDKKSNLSEELLKYEQNSKGDKRLSILSSFQKIDKKELKNGILNKDGNKFLNLVNEKISNSQSMLEKKGYFKKISNVENMKFNIEKMYQRLTGLDDIQILCNLNNDFRDCVLQKLNEGFYRIITQEKQKDQNRGYENCNENISKNMSKEKFDRNSEDNKTVHISSDILDKNEK